MNAMCPDIPRGNTANHVDVEIYYCNGGANQQWTYEPTTGYPRVQHSGMCLTITSFNYKSKTTQDACGQNYQHWDVNF
ncbi:ricin-type beta-trefoil lectin domain protein [Actinokineospora sp. NBRC 105648]|uniref:RICIN domain-containing protein n=1 Tax=Actinokineospora sp. NBRC 105648 TaxID=3032206 RepID=UPI0024A0914F|nr:hypothetical protein Acsp05_02890 [Actinokineospora sp. NBRC 105648]